MLLYYTTRFGRLSTRRVTEKQRKLEASVSYMSVQVTAITDVGMWTGSCWLRIGTGGGHL